MSDRQICPHCKKWRDAIEFRGLFDEPRKTCRKCRKRRINKANVSGWISHIMRQLKGSDY